MRGLYLPRMHFSCAFMRDRSVPSGTIVDVSYMMCCIRRQRPDLHPEDGVAAVLLTPPSRNAAALVQLTAAATLG